MTRLILVAVAFAGFAGDVAAQCGGESASFRPFRNLAARRAIAPAGMMPSYSPAMDPCAGAGLSYSAAVAQPTPAVMPFGLKAPAADPCAGANFTPAATVRLSVAADVGGCDPGATVGATPRAGPLRRIFGRRR